MRLPLCSGMTVRFERDDTTNARGRSIAILLGGCSGWIKDAIDQPASGAGCVLNFQNRHRTAVYRVFAHRRFGNEEEMNLRIFLVAIGAVATGAMLLLVPAAQAQQSHWAPAGDKTAQYIIEMERKWAEGV